MQAVAITIPVDDTYTVGDCADVYVDGEKLNKSPIAFFPEGSRYESRHLVDAHLSRPHLGVPPAVGHLEGMHLYGTHLRPAKPIRLVTHPLYHGEHVIQVRVFDYLGNESLDDPAEDIIMIETGPTAPKNLRFHSQDVPGPVTFSFTPSVELQT